MLLISILVFVRANGENSALFPYFHDKYNTTVTLIYESL